MLEHGFAPFLECCGDAVMFAKRNVVIDDDGKLFMHDCVTMI